MANKHAPSPGQIETLNARAAEYGYGVDADGRILLSSGKLSSCRVVNHRGGIRVIAHRESGANTLWTGSDIGAFLEAFWYAKRKPQAAG
jgi:hypothetical protein